MKVIIISSVFILCCCLHGVSSLPRRITIGGIFDAKDERLERAFGYAVDMINAKNLLPGSTLIGRTVRIQDDNSFYASKRVCSLLRNGVAAIFGPQNENTANHIQSICDNMEIPHIETRWDYKQRGEEMDYSVNLYPYPPSLDKAYFDILGELQWKSFVLLYDNNEGLVRLQSLLKADKWIIGVRKLDESGDYRSLLKDILKSQEKKIVLHVADEILYEVLRQANEIGLMTEYFSYFITALNFNLVDIEEFKHQRTNITGIQLIDPKSPMVMQAVEDWKRSEMVQYRVLPPHLELVTTETALMHDAVLLFAHAMADLEANGEVEIQDLFCEADNTWTYGSSLLYHLKMRRPRQVPSYYNHLRNNYTHFGHVQAQSTGMSGIIRFDNDGFRSDFQLDILELDVIEGLKKVGVWTLNGANYSRTLADTVEAMETSLKTKEIRVSTAMTAPYSMRKKDYLNRTGNDRYEGFCIDLIDKISKIRGFNYTFREVADGAYGSKQGNGEWNGIIGELLENTADLGIVDLTITHARADAVDFSMPFMNLGISIMYKKPQKKDPNLFSFMSPFSADVWLYMATAYLGVSLVLYILARMVPDEWECPYPCIQEPEELENSFTLLNCLWFIIGTFLCQGGDIAPKAVPEEWTNPYPCVQEPEELENCFSLVNSLWFIIATFLCQGADIAPRGVSTRMVAMIWWFFTLIMISSYTANLAAFLTVERMDAAIESADDLAKQTKIKYGCKEGGSTYGFFKHNNIPTYQRMWAAMSNAQPTVFTKSNDDGVERVSKAEGQYAFLMESSSIEYEIERKCDLMQIGELLDSKSYGIALPPGSPYTGLISSAILKLKEDGDLTRLKTYWWKGSCVADDSDSANSAELGISNVGGVFVVMVGGSVVACFVACCEFLWKARKLYTEYGASFGEEFCKELLFVVNFKEDSKPVRKKPSPSDTDSSIYDESSSTYGYSDKK